MGNKKMIMKGAMMKLGRAKRQRIISCFVFVTRLAFGCMFIYSSLSKIRQPYDFLSDAYSYELVGPKIGMMTAMILPWLELFVGISLVSGIFTGGALLSSAAMAVMFTFVISSALYRGLSISCGCFRSGAGIISYSTLIRAILILLLIITAYLALVLNSRYPDVQKNDI